jgi:hypothetical protein
VSRKCLLHDMMQALDIALLQELPLWVHRAGQAHQSRAQGVNLDATKG